MIFFSSRPCTFPSARASRVRSEHSEPRDAGGALEGPVSRTIPHCRFVSDFARRKCALPSSAKHANVLLPTRTISEPNCLLHFHDTKSLVTNVARLVHVYFDVFHTHCLVEAMIVFDLTQFDDAVEEASAVEYRQRIQPRSHRYCSPHQILYRWRCCCQ